MPSDGVPNLALTISKEKLCQYRVPKSTLPRLSQPPAQADRHEASSAGWMTLKPRYRSSAVGTTFRLLSPIQRESRRRARRFVDALLAWIRARYLARCQPN